MPLISRNVPARRRMALALTSAVALASTGAVHAAAAQARRHSDAPLWLGAGALLAGSALLDHTIDAAVPQGGGTRWEWASNRLNYGGRPQYAVAGLALTWAGGTLAHAPAVARAAEHVTAALLVSGVANGALKYGVGRERPEFTSDPHRFSAFNSDDRWQSFPSGHAVVAFSLAASISEEARRPWVTAATYTTAGLVGWSRIYEDRHWTSDVVGGALVGIATSRATIHYLHHRRARQGDGDAAVAIAPLPGGVIVTIRR